MSLSNTIKTHLLDPRTMNNSRCEFRLDDAFYASSWKLVDLGAYDANVDGDSGLYHPVPCGVGIMIKNIYLYAGNTLIDSLQECPTYYSIQNARTTNQGSEDINKFGPQSGLGWLVSPKSVIPSSDNGSFTLYADYVDYTNTQGGVTSTANMKQMAAASESGLSGSVNLSDFLEFLRSVPVLPAIPELRLVIEWNTTAADFFNDPTAAVPVAVPAPLPKRPTLIVDELLGVDDGTREFKLPYLSNILERFVVGSVVAGAKQIKSFNANAFSARYLKDLTLWNRVTTDDGWMTGKTRSPAMKGEKIQLVINGANFLPDQGDDHPGLKNYYMNDTLGALNFPVASGFHDLATGASGEVIDVLSRPAVSNFNVHSYRVEGVIDRLQIEYERTGFGVGDQASAFELYAYGRVAKLLELRNGQLRVSY